MKIADKVRAIGIPAVLPEEEMNTHSLFEACLGRVFPITGSNGQLLELEVGEAVGEVPSMHSIWVEPEFVELVEPAP